MSESQMFVKFLAAHAQQQLPEGYQIALRFSQGDYTAVLLDPDGTQLSNDTRQEFPELCEIAQQDAKRRAGQ